jgi:hypothetical protein
VAPRPPLSIKTGWARHPSVGVAPPSNLTLSPASETSRAASLDVHRGMVLATWNGPGGDFLARIGGYNTASANTSVADILGTNGESAVTSSPSGRIYLYANSRLSFSDDGGATWSRPMTAPTGSSPQLAVDPSGYVWLLAVNGGSLDAYLQETTGAWSASRMIAAGVSDYDLAVSDDKVFAAVLHGGGASVFSLSKAQGVRQIGVIGSGGESIRLTYRKNILTVGIGVGGEARLYVSRNSAAWEGPCVLQHTWQGVGATAGFPSGQADRFVAFWVLRQAPQSYEAYASDSFPYIVLSSLWWEPSAQCITSPAPSMADDAFSLRAGPPGLFFLRVPQTNFRVAVNDTSGMIVFDAKQLDGATDVYLGKFDPDTVTGIEPVP